MRFACYDDNGDDFVNVLYRTFVHVRQKWRKKQENAICCVFMVLCIFVMIISVMLVSSEFLYKL